MDLQPLFDALEAAQYARELVTDIHITDPNAMVRLPTMRALVQQGYGIPQIQAWLKNPGHDMVYRADLKCKGVLFWCGMSEAETEALRDLTMAVAKEG